MKSLQPFRTAILFSVLFLSSLFTVNAQGDQIESAESGLPGDFCNDPNACNFSPIIFDSSLETEEEFQLRGLIIGNDCIYPQWYIPIFEGGGGGPILLSALGGGSEFPAVQSCEPIEGYVLAESQCCAANLVASDNYCINVAWDFTCQSAYDSCVSAFFGGLDDCNDSAACNFNPQAFCSDNISCEYEQWYIPSTPDDNEEEPNFPAILACEAPLGYELAEQCCVIQRIIIDDFCLITTWDSLCQNDYESCVTEGGTITGCTDPNFCNYNPVACTEDFSCYGEKGCTNSIACNYNENAQCNDDSCELPGCIDSQAANFNPIAQCSNGLECVYCDNCPGDFDGNGFINTADLGGFLSAFGSACEFFGGPVLFD